MYPLYLNNITVTNFLQVYNKMIYYLMLQSMINLG